jgi:hypothetical protein
MGLRRLAKVCSLHFCIALLFFVFEVKGEHREKGEHGALIVFLGKHTSTAGNGHGNGHAHALTLKRTCA